MNTRGLVRGELLFYEGDPSRDIFVLNIGTLLVLKGSIVICELHPPSFIGELGCIMNASRSTTVIAKTPAALDVHSGKDFTGSLTLESEQGMEFLEGLVRRFEATRERVNEYQYRIISECLAILAVLIAEKQIAETQAIPSEIKKIRPGIAAALGQLIRNDDAVEDFAVLKRTAEKHGLKPKFDAALFSQFRSFTPLDLSSFKAAPLNTYVNFKIAAADIAEKIIVLTRYLADFQALELMPVNARIAHAERSLPFEVREQCLREIFLGTRKNHPRDEFKAVQEEFNTALKLFKSDEKHPARSLFPISRTFEIDRPYLKSLQTPRENSAV